MADTGAARAPCPAPAQPPCSRCPKRGIFPQALPSRLTSSGSAWPTVNNSPRPERWMLPSQKSLNIHGEGREGKGKGGEGWFGVGAASLQPLQLVTPRCGCGGAPQAPPLAARALCGCRQPPGVVFGAGPVAGSHLGAEQHAVMLQLLFGEGGGWGGAWPGAFSPGHPQEGWMGPSPNPRAPFWPWPSGGAGLGWGTNNPST